MKRYFINSRPLSDGRHIIHLESCPFLPDHGKRMLLGSFAQKGEASREGGKHFVKTGCCPFCLHGETSHEEDRVSEIKAGHAFISSSRIRSDFRNVMYCALS